MHTHTHSTVNNDKYCFDANYRHVRCKVKVERNKTTKFFILNYMFNIKFFKSPYEDNNLHNYCHEFVLIELFNLQIVAAKLKSS